MLFPFIYEIKKQEVSHFLDNDAMGWEGVWLEIQKPEGWLVNMESLQFPWEIVKMSYQNGGSIEFRVRLKDLNFLSFSYIQIIAI